MDKQKLWLLALCFPLLVTGQVKQVDFDSMVSSLCSGSVPYISAEEFGNLQHSSGSLRILDTREKEEYQVSHIPGSSWVGYESFAPKRVKAFEESDTIVVYCSVGYRSEKIGEKLRAMGYKNVYNLYGGIFEWKNEGNTVVDQSGMNTEKVHTYNEDWSVWLEKGEKVYE